MDRNDELEPTRAYPFLWWLLAWRHDMRRIDGCAAVVEEPDARWLSFALSRADVVEDKVVAPVMRAPLSAPCEV